MEKKVNHDNIKYPFISIRGHPMFNDMKLLRTSEFTIIDTFLFQLTTFVRWFFVVN